MFNFFKNLGLAFKNKTTTAESLWKIIGPPIVLTRKWSKVREKITVPPITVLQWSL